jgi:rSAM/selenodomain-associated transferase 2
MISVVIPTVNEAENLARCVTAVRASDSDFEMLVADGGSEDMTLEIARSLGATVLSSRVKQRAAQMNLGARHSCGEILLFLHADTILPWQGLTRIQKCLIDNRIGGGGFARRFDSKSFFLRLTCRLALIRNVAIGWHLGDQAMFVRRKIFDELGGFKCMDLFEDLDFSRRLRAKSKVVTLDPPVFTSARRFAIDGPMRRTVKDLLLTFAYLRGGLTTAKTAKHQTQRGGETCA